MSQPQIALPPYRMRMGGQHFKKDDAFIKAGVRDVRLLKRRAGLSETSRVLDWGCGAGRLAVGIKTHFGHVADYHGVDVQAELVEWAQENLADDHTRFTLVDQRNERYNPEGRSTYEIPHAPGTVDVFYAYSVFSHMLADDVAGYSATIAGLLAPEGRAMITAFAEQDVPECVENPTDFAKLDWSGALHCVRFERGYLERLFHDAGLRVDEFSYARETDGQSRYLLARR